MAVISLTSAKSRYKKAKTIATKTKVMNLAMLNLSYSDQQKFVKWQVDQSKK
jgi:hypothetical protein